MLIVCPSCATAYPIDRAAVGRAGHTLHCAYCNASWLAEGLEFVPGVEAFADPAIAQAESAAAPAVGPALTFGEMAFTPFSSAAFSSPAKDDVTAEPAELMAEIDFPALLTQPLETDDVVIAAEVAAAEPFETIEETALAPPVEDEPPQVANGDLDSEYIESFAARRRRLQARRKDKRRSSDWTAVLVLIACSVTAVSARSEVVRYLPHTASLFAAIGLPVNLRHLEFEDVKIAKDVQGGLIVQGAVVSSASKPIEVPRLHFAARNATGQDIYTWTERPSRSILGPGERLEFNSRVTSPPPGASDVLVRFANAQDAAAAK